MEVITQREPAGNVLVLAVREENLDASNVKAFKDAIHPLIENESRVVFDMSSLKFVDSSGLGALISCLRLTARRNGDFKLFGLSRPVRALFELMRMQRVFNLYDTRGEAVAAFG